MFTGRGWSMALGLQHFCDAGCDAADRPVVDRTGISGRFDYNVTFTPDDSEFNGHPPKLPQTETSDSAPNLFAAIQEQLGLRLVPAKGPVDVLVIDHVERPSDN